MRLLQRLRLCTIVNRRFYTNRNILFLRERGLIQEIFPENSTKEISDTLNASPQCVYAGFDPTANSLHVGNLLIIVNMLHWQRSGHKVIGLLGGATGLIGDPSGRTTERSQLGRKITENNISGIKNNIVNIFENHEKYIWQDTNSPLQPVEIVNNIDWYKDMNAVDFVSSLGRHFRMGTMLLKQSVQTRMKSDAGMSFTEFAYQIFQAYDWLCLYKQYNCSFQIGGSDQMGNLLAGHDLISRIEKKPVYGMTMPLITTEEGDKFGKSSGNAIWLDNAKTSPFSFYQFFLRTKDSEVEKLLKYFTFFTLGEITHTMTLHNKKPENKIAQKKLASFLTLLVHGENGLRIAELTSEVLYSKNIEALLRLDTNDMSVVFENAPTVTLILEPGLNVLDLAMKAKCFAAENDAIRIIKAGGFYINNQKVTNEVEALTESVHILPNRCTLLRVGKKNYNVVKWT